MVDEGNTVEKEKEEKTTKVKVSKPLKKKYEIILVSEAYLVYKMNNGNGWISITDSKKYKVGDSIEI